MRTWLLRYFPLDAAGKPTTSRPRDVTVEATSKTMAIVQAAMTLEQERGERFWQLFDGPNDLTSASPGAPS